MKKYRIENVQKATLNRRPVKLFKAFEYDQEAGAYVFCGQFEAPQNTPDSQLENYIDQGG